MRRSLAKLPFHPVIGLSAAPLSTASGGGRGSGGPFNIQFTVNESHPGNPNQDENNTVPPNGHGRGRGVPLAPPPFSNTSPNRPPIGRGRIFANPQFTNDHKPDSANPVENRGDVPVLPGELIDASSGGAGRGKWTTPTPVVDRKPIVENRHIRQRPQPEARPRPPPRAAASAAADGNSSGPELTMEEKVKKAVKILSKGSRDGGGTRGGRGGQGRGREGEGSREDQDEEIVSGDERESKVVNIRDTVAGQQLKELLGHEGMEEVANAFESALSNVCPTPEELKYRDDLHTDLMLECEPEFFMEDFHSNPDIDDKPIMPLEEAFEKVKPFIMAYEGIQNEEEWKKVVKETMRNVPLAKQIVDELGGPDRVTAKQQQKELEGIAKTLPTSARESVKHFTDRALLSLQSNPGWGFDKKCLFMDKLVREVSKQY